MGVRDTLLRPSGQCPREPALLKAEGLTGRRATGGDGRHRPQDCSQKHRAHWISRSRQSRGERELSTQAWPVRR